MTASPPGTRWLRRLRHAVAALAIAGLAAVLLPAPAASADPADSVPDFLGCLRGQKAGSLLILFDTTGSLRGNDPDLRRADAAKALVAELSAFATANQVQLSAAMAGFGAEYQREGEWTALGSASGLEEMNATIDTVSAITSGTFESDFWTALQGARADLRQHNEESPAPEVAAGRCHALLWFTDGEFNLAARKNRLQEQRYGETKPYAPHLPLTDPKNIPAAIQKGVDGICVADGPADQLRADNVTIWAVGLSPPNQPDKPDLSLLQRVAEGEDAGGLSCGKLRTPPGKYFQVDDVSKLVREIWELTHPDAQHLQRFVLDDALSGVSIAAHQSNGQGLTIVGPGSIGSVDIPHQDQGPGSAKLSSGVTATWRWDAPDSVTIEVSRGTSPSWLGIWSIQTPDGRPADPDDLQVSFRGDLVPAWADGNELVSGEVNQVRLGLARPDGSAVQPQQVPGTLVVDGRFVPPTSDPTAFAQQLDKANLEQPRPLDLAGVPAGPASVRLTLSYTTQVIDGLRTTLAPQVVIVPVEVQPPPDRGRADGFFDFGDVTGPADADAVVTVSGPSCVWLDSAQTTYVGPPEIDAAAVTSPHDSRESCLTVADGSRADLPAHLTTTHGGTGGLTGTVVLELAPQNDPDRAVSMTVDFSAELSNPIDLGVAGPTFLVVFLLGLGIPIGLLYFFKARNAKIPGHPLEAVMVPISIVDGEVRHAGHPLTSQRLPAPQAVNLLRKGTRTTTAAGVALQTRMGAKPFGAGFVEAMLPGHVGASSTAQSPYGKNRAAKLPLAVHNTWAVFHDPAGDPAEARLLLLRGLDLDAAGIESLVADARTSVGAVLAGISKSGAPPTRPGSGPIGEAGSTDFGLGGSTPPPTTAPGGAPDWGSASFGTFGLGTPNPPDDPPHPPDDRPGERKAP